MASSFWWFLDALIVSVIIISAYCGAKKGFLGMLASTLGCVVSMAFAVAVSSPLSDSLYDSLLSESIRTKAGEAIASYEATDEISLALASNYEGVSITSNDVSKALSNPESISESINTLICSGTGQTLSQQETDKLLQDAFETTFSNRVNEMLPSFCMQKLREETKSSNEILADTVYAVVSGNSQTAAEFIETTYIRPVVVAVIKTAVIILIFLVLSVIINFVSGFLLKAILPSPVKTVDKFAGLIIGASLGLIISIVIGMGTDTLITLSDGNLIFLNESTIEKTKLFKYIIL